MLDMVQYGAICVQTQNSHVLTKESFALTHVTSISPPPNAIEMAGCWLLRSPIRPLLNHEENTEGIYILRQEINFH